MRQKLVSLSDIEDLSRLVIRGFDGEGQQGDSAGDGSDDSKGGDGDGDGSGGDDGAADDDDTGGDDDDVPDDVQALQKALKAERGLRKKAEKGQKLTEREKRKLEKAQADIKAAEDGEVAAAKKKADESEAKVKGLAERLRITSIEGAITKAARAANFRDPDDVIAHLQRNNFKDLEIEQDEDDPSDIDIDEKSVQRAVKAVATAKPHWLVASGDQNASGGQFNGEKKGGKNDRTKELQERFPAMRNRL